MKEWISYFFPSLKNIYNVYISHLIKIILIELYLIALSFLLNIKIGLESILIYNFNFNYNIRKKNKESSWIQKFYLNTLFVDALLNI